MAKPTTVVKVCEAGNGNWKVFFSQPVYFWVYPEGGLQYSWYTEDENNIILRTDELGAYMWGLKVIEAHYERIKKEQGDGLSNNGDT